MTRLLVHAIGPAELDPGCLEGLGGAPIRRLAVGHLAAWGTEETADLATNVSRAALLEHHRIIEALSAAGPCLPARFTAPIEADAAIAALREQQDHLLGALERIAGRRELAVTALWRDEAPGSPEQTVDSAAGPGARYLLAAASRHRATAARRRRAAALASALDREIALPPEDVQHRLCPSAATALSTALLVPSADAPALAGRAASLAPAFPDVRLLVHGPWPPYSFLTNVGSR